MSFNFCQILSLASIGQFPENRIIIGRGLMGYSHCMGMEP